MRRRSATTRAFTLLYTIITSILVTHKAAANTIDVVIPCASKDKRILSLCIDYIRSNGQNVGRIIVVSAEPLTNRAEWFDEARYPFSQQDILHAIIENPREAAAYQNHPANRIGWIYQQLLKLYAPVVIPNLTQTILILDADTLFLRPVEFITTNRTLLYTTGTEYHAPYFAHMGRLLPSLRRVFPAYSGIANHMLFEKGVIVELFNAIQQYHQDEPWRALCRCIDRQELFGSCMSEYEIYFNFIFGLKKKNIAVRQLKWHHQAYIQKLAQYQKELYDYVSCHSYLQ